MALKAKQPEAVEKRLKMFLYGPPGSRKTTSAIQFPHSVLLDMEKGSENYAKSMKENDVLVLQTTNPEEILEEIHSLLTEKHDRRTLILDPVTIFYEATQAKWTRIFEKYEDKEKNKELGDFGMRYWGKVKSNYKSMLRMLLDLDMNIIMTAHQKDVYGAGMQKLGVGPDSMKGDNYFFDNVFQLNVRNGKAIATTIKQRSEPLFPPKFPDEFEWSYQNFCDYYGKQIIEKEATPVPMATNEHVTRLNELIKGLNTSPETIDKWLQKADCDSFEQMSAEVITSLITYCEKQIMQLSMSKSK